MHTEAEARPAPPTLPFAKRRSYIQYEDDNGETGEVAYPINFSELYNLKGRLLTIIDATFADPQQRKAQKDVVWQALQHWMHDVAMGAGWTDVGPVTVFSDDSSDSA